MNENEDIIYTSMRESQFNDDSKTADVIIFEPNVRGNGGRGINYYPSSLVSPEKLQPFVGKVGYKRHPRDAKEESDMPVDEIAWVVESVSVKDGKPMARVKFLDDGFYGKIKTAKDYIGISMAGDVYSTRIGTCPDGKRGKIIQAFSENIRIDAVEKPGAGGRVVRVQESESGGDTVFEDLTLDKLESDDNGKKILAQIRENLTTELTATFNASISEAVNKAVSEANSKKDQEIATIKESFAASGNTDQMAERLASVATENAELKSTVNTVSEELKSMRLESAIFAKVRESNVPNESIEDATSILRVLPQEKWNTYLSAYANAPKNGSKATPVEGATSRVLENSNGTFNTPLGDVPQKTIIEGVAKGLFGVNADTLLNRPAVSQFSVFADKAAAK